MKYVLYFLLIYSLTVIYVHSFGVQRKNQAMRQAFKAGYLRGAERQFVPTIDSSNFKADSICFEQNVIQK
jgi:hypothetical protein